MLSLFPSLLSWNQLSPFLIRLCLGITFIFLRYKTFKKSGATPKEKVVSVIEFVSAILILIGLWTQLAAIVIAIDMIIRLLDKAKSRAFLTDGVNYYLILFVLAISLALTGAGFFAFDMPL